MSETTMETTNDGPSYDLGSVNVDSLKEILDTLGNAYPFQDETSKVAFHAQVSGINTAGDPHAEASEVDTAEVNALEAKVAELQAQLDAAKNPSDPQNAPTNPGVV